jgi:4'-phosphopantetheinyl transferase
MIHVWRVALDTAEVPPPTAGEAARAARFATEELGRRYLAAHGALRAILGKFTPARLEFALLEKGKPYLPLSPEVRFNLSHSHERALIAVALDIDVGVDIERIRPIANYAAVADRFFPPGEEQPSSEVDFFRRWTRVEALLKAHGVGLYGAGAAIEGEWTVETIDAGDGFTGAVAAAGKDPEFQIHDFGANE